MTHGVVDDFAVDGAKRIDFKSHRCRGRLRDSKPESSRHYSKRPGLSQSRKQYDEEDYIENQIAVVDFREQWKGRKVGVQRRVRVADVVAYQKREKHARRKVLTELAREGQRLGLGE